MRTGLPSLRDKAMRATSPPGGRREAAGTGRPPLLLRVALGAALALAIGASIPASSMASPRCIDGSATEARIAGSDEGPPRFTAAFFKRVMSIDASTDGLDEGTLPISIEAVCGLPRTLTKQGSQLAGGDGVALISSRTTVWKGGLRLQADKKLSELDNADTARLRVRLVPQARWTADEDGNPVPTFTTTRIVITD